MIKRHACAVLGLGLLLAGSTAVMAGEGPAVASSVRTSVAHRVDQAHQQLHEQKAQNHKLRHQVNALQKQQQAARKHITQTDQAIARLREQLKQLQDDSSGQ